MSRERYVHDLQLILTGEGQADQDYRFHLASQQSGSPILQLCYEKMQSDMLVSGMLWFADYHFPFSLLGSEFILLTVCEMFSHLQFCYTVWCLDIGTHISGRVQDLQ